MTAPDDEDAWRAIVDNYGERPSLDLPPGSGSTTGPEPADDAAADAWPEPEPDPVPDPLPGFGATAVPEERFVPPEPPPVPAPPPARLAAWLGLLGTPVVLVLALLAGVSLPGWAGYGLLLAFLGGFGYLVWHMQREPRDPWDDGAQV